VRRVLAALLAAAGLVAVGCDSDDDDGGSAESRQVTTTRVQVVEGIGREGGFDPRQIYERLSPGVVTVISIFEGSSLIEAEGEGGQGSGFVLDGEGYVATNAHVVTTGGGDHPERAEEVFVELSDGEKDNVLTGVARGEAPGETWSRLPAKRFFRDVLCITVVKTYYTHPRAWNEIGYSGPSSPRGHVRNWMGGVDPWDARETGT
jgi:hypothetical protein